MNRSLIHSLLAFSSSQIIQFALQIISVPLYLSSWGKTQYGEWLILQAIASYLFISDFGFSQTVSNKLLILIHQNKENESKDLFQLSFYFSLVLSVIFGSVIFLVFHLFNLKTNYESSILFFLLLHTLLQQRTGYLHDALRAKGQVALATHLNNIIKLLESTIAIILVLLKFPAHYVAISFCVSRLLFFTLYYLWLRNHIHWCSLRQFPSINFKDLKQYFKPSIGFLVFPLTDRLKNDFLVTLIGIFLGPISVVSYSTMRMVANFSFQIYVVLKNSFWPEIAKVLASENYFKARILHATLYRLAIPLVLLSSLFAYFFAPKYYTYWTYKTLNWNSDLFLFFTLGILLHILWNGTAIVALAVNRHVRISKYYLLNIVLSLLFTSLFMKRGGILTPAFALCLAECFMIPLAFKESLKLINESFFNFLRLVLNISREKKIFQIIEP